MGPAPRGRTRRRDASCEQQSERPTDGQPRPFPPGVMAGTEERPPPALGRTPPHLCGPPPRPGAPHPGRLRTGPHSRKQEIHPERKHGRGGCVCTQRPGDLPSPCAHRRRQPDPPSGTAPPRHPPTASLQPPGAGARGGGDCCSAVGCRCSAPGAPGVRTPRAGGSGRVGPPARRRPPASHPGPGPGGEKPLPPGSPLHRRFLGGLPARESPARCGQERERCGGPGPRSSVSSGGGRRRHPRRRERGASPGPGQGRGRSRAPRTPGGQGSCQRCHTLRARAPHRLPTGSAQGKTHRPRYRCPDRGDRGHQPGHGGHVRRGPPSPPPGAAACAGHLSRQSPPAISALASAGALISAAT